MKSKMIDLCVGTLILSSLQINAAVNTSAGYGNSDERFLQFPVYSGDDLEFTVVGNVAHFRLWSPEAQQVMLRLYSEARGGVPLKEIAMTKSGNGTWVAEMSPVPYGKFYTFSIQHNDRWLQETPGIWAKAVGVNGGRAAVIDMASTDPEGWDADRGPEINAINDAVIYELHHRDFSIHPSSGIVNKGKFLAMSENSTVSPAGDATGIDHLKELGVTHVHILPSYDFNSVDETQLPLNGYNWGYDPQNYNVPEGSYSTNPADPSARITEMKKMIKALHDAGIGVVMDVVYNHTAQNDDSNFSLTAPGKCAAALPPER